MKMYILEYRCEGDFDALTGFTKGNEFLYRAILLDDDLELECTDKTNYLGFYFGRCIAFGSIELIMSLIPDFEESLGEKIEFIEKFSIDEYPRTPYQLLRRQCRDFLYDDFTDEIKSICTG